MRYALVISLLGATIILCAAFSTPKKTPSVAGGPSVRAQVLSKTIAERASFKGAAIAQQQVVGEFTNGEYRIEIESVEAIENGVQVYARAWKNNQQVGFGADGSIEWERFRIFNPPIMVPDGTTSTTTNSFGKEVVVNNFKEDLVEALRLSLTHVVSVSAKDVTPTPGTHGNTTDTYFPDAGIGATTVDGSCAQNNEANFAAARAGAGEACGPSGSPDSIGVFVAGGVYLFRGKFLFDTSPISDTDTISSATFSAWPTTDLGNRAYGLIQAGTASNNDLVAGDFDNPTADGYTEGAARIDGATWGTGAYEDFTLNATGLGFISKTGVTKLEIRSTDDLDNSDPGAGDNYTNVNFADTAGTTNDPMLVVVHAAVASALDISGWLLVL